VTTSLSCENCGVVGYVSGGGTCIICEFADDTKKNKRKIARKSFFSIATLYYELQVHIK
jgi:hypothetical protein